VRFEIAHEFDAPLDTVELAVLSPELGSLLARSIAAQTQNGGPRIESVETVSHVIDSGECRRVLRFQASAPFAILEKLASRPIARDAMTWKEFSTYRLADHASTWHVAPKEEWRRWFRGEGTYRLEAVADGRTRRTVVGDLEIKVRVVGKLAERMALAEVRKTYDAEADTLRALATL
jgi:hypothetical protein